MEGDGREAEDELEELSGEVGAELRDSGGVDGWKKFTAAGVSTLSGTGRGDNEGGR